VNRAARVSPAVGLAALAALTAIVALALGGGGMNIDIENHIAWGEGIWDGRAPDLDAPGAKTPHPLTILAAAIADLLPVVDPHPVMMAVSYAGHAALILIAALIAWHLFNVAAAVATVAILAVAWPMSIATASGFWDVVAAALILYALLLELRRPGRGVAPLVVLALAGLIRPEAWGFAIAYWLWLARDRDGRERVRLAVLALAAPILWALMDLALTGNPTSSFTRTREGAEVAQRVTGIDQAPRQLGKVLRDLLDRPALAVAAAATVGAVLAATRLRRLVREDRRLSDHTLIVAATLVLSCLAFLALGAGRLSLLHRYALLPAALLAVFFGFGVTAWWHAADRRLAIVLAALAAVAVGSALYLVPNRLRADNAHLSGIREAGRAHADLRALLDAPVARRCTPAFVDDSTAVPYVAVELDRAPEAIELLEGDPGSGVLVRAIDEFARDTFLNLGLAGGPIAPRLPGWDVAGSNRRWELLARGCG
jgi:hypothetical protein